MSIYDLALSTNDAVACGRILVNDLWAFGAGEIECHDLLEMNGNRIYHSGHITPHTDAIKLCGSWDRRWSQIHGVNIYGTVHEPDHVFEEKTCCLCNKEFKEGEGIVSYILSNTEEGTRTIPAHLSCSLKPENQTKEKHDKVIQKLKDTGKYIDPIKEMEEEAKLEEVKMEKITLKDGKKGLLVAREGKIRAFSEEQLLDLEKIYLDKLAEIQKYIKEINKKEVK